jgi:hypothetical protein
MKTRATILTVAVCVVAVAVGFASNANMGTWKLNEAKSKIPPMATKNNTVVYEAAGDSIKVTVDGVSGDGKPFHSEWTGKLDGKDYALTGDPTADTRAYKTVDAHTTDIVNKKAGKIVGTGRIVVSADGMSRTLTVNATDASGKKVKYAGIYDKQ